MQTATQAPPGLLTPEAAAAELEAARHRLEDIMARLPDCRSLRGGSRQWLAMLASVQAAALSCKAAERCLS